MQSEYEVKKAKFRTLKMVQFKIKLRNKVGKLAYFSLNVAAESCGAINEQNEDIRKLTLQRCV